MSFPYNGIDAVAIGISVSRNINKFINSLKYV